jgi:hypothetical protein
VQDAFDAVTITSSDHIIWLGRQVSATKPTLIHTTKEDRHSDLVGRLTAILYDAFYCLGGVLCADYEPREMSDWTSEVFVRNLIEQNAGTGFGQHGWEVLGWENGRLIASRDGLTVAMESPESDTRASVGDTIAIRSAKGSLTLSPGYYFAFGDAGLVEVDPVVRVYWNATAEGGGEIIRCVTRCLNQKRVPFGLKVLTNSTAYRRADSAVLYLARDVYFEVVKDLIGVYRTLQPTLRPATPVFTKVLAPGVGLAESPSDGESFGHHRSSLLADAIIRAHEECATSAHSRITIYDAILQDSDLDPARPYLNPGSQDSYPPWQVLRAGRSKTLRSSEGYQSRNPLEIAFALGLRLSEEALWSEGRCTWLGIETDLNASSEAASAFCWSTLDAGLYSGPAGVGLFLAHLARETGEPGISKTAIGAARQALTQLDQVPSESRFGCHTGWAGIACASLEAGDALNNSEVCDAGFEVARRLAQEDRLIEDPRTEIDFMTGKAGALAVITTRKELAGDSALMSFAGRLGEQLIRDAVSRGPGLGWLNPRSAQELPLAGLSHGASGIALALLELDRVAACVEARRTAELAFAYERWLFDSMRGNWPDVRGLASKRERWHESHFLTAWCHGAPGIALVRARACVLQKEDPTLHQEFEVAREATRRSIVTDLRSDIYNCSLCHGVLGNAEVLAVCGQILGEPDDPLVEAVAAQVSARAGPDLRSWPSDFPLETPPGLLLGLAGVGMFYLRRARPTVPSPLLPWIGTVDIHGRRVRQGPPRVRPVADRVAAR